MSNTPKPLVIAAMRNEGAFIVEWVAWYRALGFDILVLTNDCTDASPALLDTFADAGWLTHLPHVIPEGAKPKPAAHRAALAHPLTQAADWAFVCDVDEFLTLKFGDGTITSFLDTIEPDFQGMAFHWRCFGTSGHVAYSDTLVHRTFTMASPPQHPCNVNFKSLIYQPRRFRVLSAHAPRNFRGAWGEGRCHWANSAGEPMPAYHPWDSPIKETPANEITHLSGAVNHYITRSVESFDAKRGTLSASRGVNRYTDAFYQRYNRNEVVDTATAPHHARFDAAHDAAMALPGIAPLHHRSCADYIAHLCAASGRDPAQDPRWIAHMERA